MFRASRAANVKETDLAALVDAGRDDVPLVQNAMALRHLWLAIDRIHRSASGQFDIVRYASFSARR
jgi:hypothetical protein